MTITLTYGADGPAFRPHPAPTRAPAKERGTAWYRGDCHLHTVHSDGKRTPDQLVADARVASLDFITSTEHNTPSAQLVWGEYATDDLLVLNGEEVTTRSGHWPAIGLPAGTWVDWRYRSSEPAEFRRFVDEVHAVGGLVTAAHPFAACFGCAFEYDYEPVDLVEVWNGPWDPTDDATVLAWHSMLRSGTRIPAIGDSDAHNPDQVVGLPQTVVLAGALERGALLRGPRRRAVLARRVLRRRPHPHRLDRRPVGDDGRGPQALGGRRRRRRARGLRRPGHDDDDPRPDRAGRDRHRRRVRSRHADLDDPQPLLDLRAGRGPPRATVGAAGAMVAMTNPVYVEVAGT